MSPHCTLDSIVSRLCSEAPNCADAAEAAQAEPGENTLNSGMRPAHENESTHSMGNRLARMIWGLVWLTLFRTSPRCCHLWRNLLLRIFGADLHRTARVYPRARIWLPSHLTMAAHACIGDDVEVYCVKRITIGTCSTISQYTFLCGASHDFEDAKHPLVPAPITIGDHCWIAADVFVGPGITIGDGTVVGARSSVFKDLPSWKIAVGTPAAVIRDRKLDPDDLRGKTE